MAQPSIITIKEDHINAVKCYGLETGVEYKTRHQLRKANDDSRIVYIANMKYNPNNREDTQWVALTENEYNVIEME